MRKVAVEERINFLQVGGLFFSRKFCGAKVEQALRSFQNGKGIALRGGVDRENSRRVFNHRVGLIREKRASPGASVSPGCSGVSVAVLLPALSLVNRPLRICRERSV